MPGKVKYILLDNKLKNCEGYMPRTVTDLRYDRKRFINRMVSKGNINMSQCHAFMVEFEETLKEVLSEGISVSFDKLFRLTTTVKGRFDELDEPFKKGKHSIVVEAKVSRHLSRDVAAKISTVERKITMAKKTHIKQIRSIAGEDRLTFDYPNTLLGMKLKPKGYELTGISLNPIHGADHKPIALGLNSVHITLHEQGRLIFSFKRDLALPEEFKYLQAINIELTYFNREKSRALTSGYFFAYLDNNLGRSP